MCSASGDSTSGRHQWSPTQSPTSIVGLLNRGFDQALAEVEAWADENPSCESRERINERIVETLPGGAVAVSGVVGVLCAGNCRYDSSDDSTDCWTGHLIFEVCNRHVTEWNACSSPSGLFVVVLPEELRDAEWVSYVALNGWLGWGEFGTEDVPSTSEGLRRLRKAYVDHPLRVMREGLEAVVG